MAAIGEVLKKARLALGLKAIDVSDELHIDESTWYKIEAGERNLNIAYLIAVSDYLKIPRLELLRELGVPLFDEGYADSEYILYSRERSDESPFFGHVECVEKTVGDRNAYELSLAVRTMLGLGRDEYDEDLAAIMEFVANIRARRVLKAMHKDTEGDSNMRLYNLDKWGLEPLREYYDALEKLLESGFFDEAHGRAETMLLANPINMANGYFETCGEPEEIEKRKGDVFRGDMEKIVESSSFWNGAKEVRFDVREFERNVIRQHDELRRVFAANDTIDIMDTWGI